MIFYKLRHIPTGLFFKPSKHSNKSNLSPKGKVYQTKPTVGWLDSCYHHPIDGSSNGYEQGKVIESDWEVVTYEVE